MRNPAVPLLLCTLILNQSAYAQEAIQVAQEAIEIEIDSAPVEIEIEKPAMPTVEEEVPAQQTAQQPPWPKAEPETAAPSGLGTVGIAIGVAVAGVLAALAGGGGGSGGGSSSTPSHP